ncbi:hypothetical protein JCM11251_000383 [Rhodosporidiobolus azoricus]
MSSTDSHPSQDLVHLRRLVRVIEASTSSPHPHGPPLDHFSLLKLQATAVHARELLDREMNEREGARWASTSRGRPQKDSVSDLEQRLDRAERTVARLAEEGKASSSSSRRPLSTASSNAPSSSTSAFLLPSLSHTDAEDEDKEDPEDDDFPLPLPLPPSNALPFPCTSASTSSSRPTTPASPPSSSSSRPSSALAAAPASEFRTASTSVLPASSPSSSTPLPRPASAAASSLAQLPKPEFTRPSSVAGTSNAFEEFGLRPRKGKEGVVPPYLAAKRAREAAKEKEKEKENESTAADKSGKQTSAVATKGKGKERAPATHAAAAAADDLLPASSGPGEGSADLLSHHHALQSSLLTDLTSLSGALKANTVAFSENLDKDREVMERAQKGLEGNSGKMGEGQKRLEKVRGRTRGTTCWTVGAVVAVVIAWVLMFGLLRLTPS